MERSYDAILRVISDLKIGETYSVSDNSNMVHNSWYTCFYRRLKGEDRNTMIDFLGKIIIEVSKEIRDNNNQNYKNVISSLKGLCNMTHTYCDESFRCKVQDIINEVNTIFNANSVYKDLENIPVTVPRDSFNEFYGTDNSKESKDLEFTPQFEIGANFEINDIFNDLYIKIYKIIQEEKSFFFRYIHELCFCSKLKSYQIDEFGKFCIFNYGICYDTISEYIKDPFYNEKKLIFNASKYENISLIFCKVCNDMCKRYFIFNHIENGYIMIKNNCKDKNILNSFFEKRIIEAPPPLSRDQKFINNLVLMSHSLNEYNETAPFITEDENEIESLKSIFGGFFHFYKNRGKFYYRIKHDINTCLYFFDKVYMVYMKKNSNITEDNFSLIPNRKITDNLFYKMPSRISKTMYNQYIAAGSYKVFNYYIDELNKSGEDSIIMNIELKLSDEKQEDFCLPFSKININKYEFLREIFYNMFYQTFTDINHKVILKNNSKLELVKQNSILK